MPPQNHNSGTYWRLAWARSWRERRPWSLNGEPMPYVGSRRDPRGVVIRAFGPLALISVTIK